MPGPVFSFNPFTRIVTRHAWDMAPDLTATLPEIESALLCGQMLYIINDDSLSDEAKTQARQFVLSLAYNMYED